MDLDSKATLKSIHNLKLSLHDTSIDQVNEAKLPGVIIDSTLAWISHIKNVVFKISQVIWNIRKCAHFYTTTIKLSL